MDQVHTSCLPGYRSHGVALNVFFLVTCILSTLRAYVSADGIVGCQIAAVLLPTQARTPFVGRYDSRKPGCSMFRCTGHSLMAGDIFFEFYRHPKAQLRGHLWRFEKSTLQRRTDRGRGGERQRGQLLIQNAGKERLALEVR